jgi:radical SAM protein with 4Fe4S-binding SPASM domain
MSAKAPSLAATTETRPRSAFEALQIARFGPRYAEYRRALDRASAMEEVPDFPLYLMLEQTFKCNLRCPSCIQGYRKATAPFAVERMTDALYERIIAEARAEGLCSLSMHVNDEPLLVANLAERIAMARDAGIMDIIMTTNGNLMTAEKARAVIEAGITHLLFSIDAASPETYEKVRPGGRFEKVLAGIDHVNAVRGATMMPILRASFVKSALNAHEEEAFHRVFGGRVDYIDVQTFGSYKDFNRHLRQSGGSRCEEPPPFLCEMPFNRMVVRSNGDVLPCCSFYGYEIVVGNILTHSIRDIWRGEAMHRLRQDFFEGKYDHPACVECINSMAID